MDELSPGAAREHRFKRLYVDLYADVLRFVQRRVAPGSGGGGGGAGSGSAEDITAEVFLAVWRRVDDVPEGRDAARAWVFGIARNLLLNNRRGARRQEALGVRLADVERLRVAGPESVDVALQVDFERAWRELTDTHQEALALTVFEGLESAEAGAVIGITATAFRLRLSRARKALRSALGREHVATGSDTHLSERI